MDFNLPEELKVIQESTRKFVDKELLPVDQQLEDTKIIPPEIIQKMRDMGYFGITLPVEYGGMELGALGNCVIQEQLAHANLCFNLLISGNVGIGSLGILHFGSEEMKQKYLPKFASGEFIAAFALTEPEAGSDAASIQTTAVKKGDRWILNGTKHFITRGDIADVIIVIAVTDKEKRAKGGISAFVVEKGFPGYRVARAQASMGPDIVHQGELVFEDCEVPEENMLGPEGGGFNVAMSVLDEGRLVQGARCLGIGERLLKMSVDYANTRVQFGKPIARNEAIRWMLADTAVELYAIRCMTYDAAWRRDQGENVRTKASMVKLFSTEAVNRIADRAVQIHGGMGYMKDFPIEAIYREVRIMRIYEGTSEVQRLIISRDVLRS
jgi:acyl-CoA dehydrogenase